MNKISSFNVNFIKSDNKIECYEIFKFSFVEKLNDIYFIDKGFDNFHISIHKDGSVWLTHQNIWTGRPNIKLFQFDWKIMDIEPEKEKPFIFYCPSAVNQYPKLDKIKNKHSNFFFKNSNIENQIFKLFLINYQTEKPLMRDCDKGLLLKQIDSINNDNFVIKDETVYENPFFMFDKHQLRFSCCNFDRNQLSMSYRLLMICQPSSDFDATLFLRNYKIEINPYLINSNGYIIRNVTINQNINLSLIIY